MSEITRRPLHWTELGEPLLGGVALAGSPARIDDVAIEERVTQLYDAYQQELYSFARTAAAATDLAEDVVQEAFTRLVREIRAGREPENPGGWLHRVAANLILTHARRRRRLARWLPPPSPRGRSVRSAEEEILAKEGRRDLERQLARLPTDARLALLMAGQGLSGREIAAALERSESATRSLICRARRRLRDELNGSLGPT